MVLPPLAAVVSLTLTLPGLLLSAARGLAAGETGRGMLFGEHPLERFFRSPVEFFVADVRIRLSFAHE